MRRSSDGRLQPLCRPSHPIHQGGYPCRSNTCSLVSTHRTGAERSSGGSTGRSMQNPGYGLLRIHLPGTWVNKSSKRKSRGAPNSPPALSHIWLSNSLCLAYDVALYATTSPAVTWGGFGSKGDRCSATNSPATKVDCSSAALCSKTLVETVTPSPASTK